VATRESINRIKIEKFRLSGVPIDPADAILQGDALAWSTGDKQAELAGPSATAFLGISETKNPIATMGDSELLSDLTSPRVNVIQQGLVERIAEHAETLYPFDHMTVGSDAQKASKLWATDATYCYVRPLYNMNGGADAPES
jgi:hypothetical protein